MSTNFPGSADDGTTLPNPGANAPTNNPSLSGGQTNQNDAIKAIEAKIGIGASTPTAGKVFRGTGTGSSAWGALDVTTDLTGVLPVANGGTGLSVLTIPASAILVGTTDTQTVTNKILSDTFQGITFISQSPTPQSDVLPASTDYIVENLLDIGATVLLEIPATSTLEIFTPPFKNSFSTANHDHTNVAGGGILTYAALLSTIFSGQVTTAANSGSWGGNNSYINLGGIKFCWGTSAAGGSALGTGAAADKIVTLPSGFFSSLQTVLIANTSSGGGFSNWMIPSSRSNNTTQLDILVTNAGSGTSGTDYQVTWLVIGT